MAQSEPSSSREELGALLRTQGRVPLLSHLKSLGVALLTDQQSVANALARSLRPPVEVKPKVLLSPVRDMWNLSPQGFKAPPTPMNLIRPGLWLGSMQAANDFDAQKVHGITHILSIGQRVSFLPAETTCKCVDADDNPKFDLTPLFEPCSRFISAARDSGGAVLVHCWQGMSRSAAIVCAHLMLTESLDRDTALDEIREKRMVISPNIGFCLQLDRLGKDIDARQRAAA